MKKVIIVLASISLISCERLSTEIERDFQTRKRNYKIVMYSGGDTVFVDEFQGILNNSRNSDGCYYIKNGELIEVSGDYVIISK